MLPQLPFHAPLVDGAGGLISSIWNQWLNQFINSASLLAGSASSTGKSASIAATTLGNGLPAGLYRASWYARITTAASVSSSLDVSLAWTDGGVAQSYAGASITGNTTTSYQSLSLPLIHVDAGTAVTYAAVYSSTGTAMVYRLDLSLERVRL